MKPKYFLDTNFIFALFFKNDALNREANLIWEEICIADIYTSVAVVAELICAGEETDFIILIEGIGAKILEINMNNMSQLSILIPPKVRRKLKAIDCIVLSQVLDSKLELITFDKDLKRQYQIIKS